MMGRDPRTCGAHPPIRCYLQWPSIGASTNAMRTVFRWGLIGAAAVGLVGAVFRRKIVPRVEEPRYELERTVEGLEIRRYPPAVIAETEVEGGYRESIYSGFRRLAGYIFGKNTPAEKIAMTAPVGATPHAARRWTISFVMPSSRRIDTLPHPIDERVHIRQIPARRAAVLRFGGRANEKVLRAREAELAHKLTRSGLHAADEPQLAQYDPPWIPGPFRRNEMMVALAEGQPIGR